MKKGLIKEAFRLQQIAGIKTINSLKENSPGFYSRDYVKQKYGEKADEIEQNIEDEGENNWDLYTSLETPAEVDEFVSGFVDESASGIQQEAYMENMGPDLEEAMFLIQKVWNHIKNDPAMETSDIASQREGILSHIKELLDF
jgi:hypothetical protein